MFGFDPDATTHVDIGSARFRIGSIPLDVLEELEEKLFRLVRVRAEAAQRYREDESADNLAAFERANSDYSAACRELCRWGVRGVEAVPDKPAPRLVQHLSAWADHSEDVTHAGRAIRLPTAATVELLGRVRVPRTSNASIADPLTDLLADHIITVQRLTADEVLGF